MDENKKLLDEALSNVAGGKLHDDVRERIEAVIKLLKDNNIDGKQDMIESFKTIWEGDVYNKWKLYSTDRSQEDLDELIAFIEEKWEE